MSDGGAALVAGGAVQPALAPAPNSAPAPPAVLTLRALSELAAGPAVTPREANSLSFLDASAVSPNATATLVVGFADSRRAYDKLWPLVKFAEGGGEMRGGADLS